MEYIPSKNPQLVGKENFLVGTIYIYIYSSSILVKFILEQQRKDHFSAGTYARSKIRVKTLKLEEALLIPKRIKYLHRWTVSNKKVGIIRER